MRIKSWIVIVLSLALVLMVLPLFVGNRAIETATHTMETIRQHHLRVSVMVHEISEEILDRQSALLTVLLDENSTRQTFDRFMYRPVLAQRIDKLETLLPREKERLKEVCEILKRRLVGFGFVERSLIEAKVSGNRIDFQDALIGYRSVSSKVLEDVRHIQDLSDRSLEEAMDKVYTTVLNARLFIAVSLLGSLVLLIHAFYTLFRINRAYRFQLERAHAAEAAQKLLEEKLRAQAASLEEEVKRKTAEITERYYHHRFTGLPNRAAFLDVGAYATVGHAAIFNVDRFQEFNDTLGEEAGNQAIIACAKFFEEHIPAHCDLFHIGGDEFLISGDAAIDDRLFEEEMIALHQAFNQHAFVVDGEEYFLICSMGIYHGRSDQIAKADIAMKEAKRQRKGYLIYNRLPDVTERYERNRHYSRLLFDALHQKKLLLYLQPIMATNDRQRTKHFEVLVRLKDTDGAIVMPERFLGVAKRLRLSAEMTKQILEQVTVLVERYEMCCSINMSIEDLMDRKLMEFIRKRLEKFKYNDAIVFEILESEAIDDYKAVERFIEMVHALGAKVALDDFGSGYSNFTHILNLDLDFIKIDASLIRRIDREEKSRLTVQTIVGLAAAIGVETVAEHVDSETIFAECERLGIDYLQGYLFSKPEPVKSFALKDRHGYSAENRTLMET